MPRDTKRVIDSSFTAVAFDLQDMLATPHGADAEICIQFHNFSNCFTSGVRYLRNETEGAKDSTEIGLALLDYLKNLPQTVIHPATFSDTCSGQNRKFSTTSNLKIIDMKFIEPGNS